MANNSNSAPSAHEYPRPLPGASVRISAELVIAIAAPRAIAQLHGWDQSHLGQPSPPNGTVEAANHRLLWNGPDSWLAVSETLSPAELVEALRPTDSASTATVTDISHGKAVLRVSGAAAADLIATGTPIDIQSARPGDSMASLHGPYQIHLHVVGADVFDLYVASSYAESFWNAILHAAEEFRA